MKKRLLYTVLSLGMIIGVLAGCGESAKEVSSSEDTQTAVEEPVKAELREELKEELKEEIMKELAEDIEDDFVDEDIEKEDTEFSANELFSKSITENFFDSSYKDFKELTLDDLVVTIEDNGKRYERNPSHNEIAMSDMDTFWGYDCYSLFELTKGCTDFAELNFIVDLGVGTEYKNNCEKLLTSISKEMYDKNSEYHLLKPEGGDWHVVHGLGYSGFNRGSSCSYFTLDANVTDAYIYLLDVNDVDNNYRDDYINLTLSSFPRGPEVTYPVESDFEGESVDPAYTYWQNWDSDCKIIKTCTVMFTDIPNIGFATMENTHGAEVLVKWYFLDNERFTALFNEYDFTNPFE